MKIPVIRNGQPFAVLLPATASQKGGYWIFDNPAVRQVAFDTQVVGKASIELTVGGIRWIPMQ